MKQKVLIMVSLLFITTISFTTISSYAQANYDPSVQSGNMQYFTPKGKNQFVGDCIPFYHNGTYYLYWLIDEGHHSSLGGLGGHQWCVSTTTDLINWEHHPIAIGIDEEWEKSICTGSVAYYNGKFYAFYATRLLNGSDVREQLSYAISSDALKFEKQKPNPFFTSAPGYSERNFRDPKVIVDEDGLFHLFVSSEQINKESKKGCLVHMTSKDLKNWTVQDPLLTDRDVVPECPDYFFWNGWYYLIYGQDGNTYYVKSHNPYGPWEEPESQALLEQWVNVAKTAQFGTDRRIVAGWVPSRSDGRDGGAQQFGGCSILREVYQLDNGDLATKFPAETMPVCEEAITVKTQAVENATVEEDRISINSPESTGRASLIGIPRNSKIILTINPQDCKEYGLRLRSNDTGTNGYVLSFNPTDEKVKLAHDAFMENVDGLNSKITVTIVMKDDIIDVDVDHRRCIVDRLPDQNGDCIWLYVINGNATFSDITIEPLVTEEAEYSEGTILPTYFLDKASYTVNAMVFNDEISWDEWRDAHDGRTGIILGTPPADVNGKQWYENDYQPTDLGNYKWKKWTTPLGTGTWANDNIPADIYMRRAFTLDKQINGRVDVRSCFDDAPCEIYLNGTLLVSYPDGDPDGSLNAHYLLTPEQQALLKTDGSVNILAMHVHNDFGGSNADVGLYISEKPYVILATHEYGCQFNNIVAADFFNDGKKEIMIGGYEGFYDSRPRWLLKHEEGKWTDIGNPINCVDRPSLSLCDFNGDGNLDVVCFENGLPSDYDVNHNRFTTDKGIYLGNGDGTFTKMEVEIVGADDNLPPNFSRPFSTLYRIRSGAVADFNNDGLPDIVGVGIAENNVVLINKGIEGNKVKLHPIYFDDGIVEGNDEHRGRSFAEAIVITTDFNNDGYTDFIISANNWEHRNNVGADWERFTEVYLNNGKSDGFTRTYWGLENPSVYNGGIAIADFNNDGYQDIYVSGDGGYFPGTPKAIELTGTTDQGYWEYTMVCINDGTGHFKALPQESFDRHKVRGLNSVANTANAYDWNGDGNIDIIHQSWCPEDNSQGGHIWINNGNSTFTRKYQYGGGSESSALIFDWNGDGIKDILSTGWCENARFVTHNYSNGRTFMVTECSEHKTEAPMPPIDVSVNSSGEKIIISWTPNAYTPKNTTYELYIKNKDGKYLGNCRSYIGGERDGQRKVEEFGNQGTNHRLEYTLPNGIYTVGVQAVNGRRDGSTFTTCDFQLDNGIITRIKNSNNNDDSIIADIYTVDGKALGVNTDSLPNGIYISKSKKFAKH
jgi:beta-fructofuranosidase